MIDMYNCARKCSVRAREEGGGRACSTSKPPGGQGRQEMASLREIGEMETKTRQK